MATTIAGLIAEFRNMVGRVSGNETDAAVRKAAELIAEEARNAIGTYEFGWPPLAASTLARKAADTPLLETGAFRDSIEVVRTGHAQYSAGSQDEKAEWFELGTSRMPPRPVMGPAAARREEEAVKIISDGAIDAVKARS